MPDEVPPRIGEMMAGEDGLESVRVQDARVKKTPSVAS